VKTISKEYITKTYESSNAVVRVYRPILTEDERERRMKRIQEATANLLKG
jgi:hypothetical protein